VESLISFSVLNVHHEGSVLFYEAVEWLKFSLRSHQKKRKGRCMGNEFNARFLMQSVQPVHFV
jgi:hypothetical protein